MIVSPSQRLWTPSLADVWASFTTGKVQRNPSGKCQRNSHGKAVRNTATKTTCCCRTCTHCATGTTPSDFTATIAGTLVTCTGGYTISGDPIGTWDGPFYRRVRGPSNVASCGWARVGTEVSIPSEGWNYWYIWIGYQFSPAVPPFLPSIATTEISVFISPTYDVTFAGIPTVQYQIFYANSELGAPIADCSAPRSLPNGISCSDTGNYIDGSVDYEAA